MILPVVTLALPQIAVVARLTRGSMIEALAIQPCQNSQGLWPYRITWSSWCMPCRGAILPVVSYLGPAAAASADRVRRHRNHFRHSGYWALLRARRSEPRLHACDGYRCCGRLLRHLCSTSSWICFMRCLIPAYATTEEEPYHDHDIDTCRRAPARGRSLWDDAQATGCLPTGPPWRPCSSLPLIAADLRPWVRSCRRMNSTRSIVTTSRFPPASRPIRGPIRWNPAFKTVAQTCPLSSLESYRTGR